MIFLRALLSAVVPVAFAQVGIMPTVPCVPNVPGCGGPANVLATSLLPSVAGFLLRAATGLSLICIIVAGLQMMTSLGDDSNISKQKWAIFYALAGLMVAILSQSLVSAVTTYQYVIGSPDVVVGEIFKLVVNVLLTLTNTVLVTVIIINGYKMLLAQGKSDEFNRARQGVLWAIAGAIVINLSYSIVRVVTSMFGT
jgi:hypothetical protein